MRSAQESCASFSSSRRDFLLRAGGGLGAIALASLMVEDGLLQTTYAATAGRKNPLAPRTPDFVPRAKRVIYLFMHGGPSHVDLFDYKPDLLRFAGQPLPESFGKVMTRRNVAQNPLLAPVRPFQKRGESGLEVSDFLPHIAECADEICLLRGVHGDSVNHPQSVYQMNTGSILMGKPSLGAWVTYGLGTVNQDMPAYVVMPDPAGGLKGGPPAWGSGYLPATYQGTPMRAGKEPILNLSPSAGMSGREQRGVLDLIQDFNSRHQKERDQEDDLGARIDAYELAFRMQSAAPDVVDLSEETIECQKLYGIGERDTNEFGTRCLLARRMIERGVRFVQLYSGDTNGWDAHNDVDKNHTEYCKRTDKPIAGLLIDLKQRGLLDDTLVVWGGEFGRMPMSEQGKGRDHNPWGYSVWLAGARVKAGFAYGETDSIGLRAEKDTVHIRDLHATILHLLGINHETLTFFHNGLDERLTGVEPSRVVTEVLA